MKIIGFLKRHLTAILFYAVYCLIAIRSIQIELYDREILRKNHGRWPYGVREWDGGLITIYAFIFLFVSVGYAATSKQRWFYIGLIVFILIPYIIWWNIANNWV